MYSPIGEVASLRQKLTDVESQVLDMQVEVDAHFKTSTRLTKTTDEQNKKTSALQTHLEAADPKVQEASRKEQEDKIHGLEARLEGKDRLMEEREEQWNVLLSDMERKAEAAGPPEERFLKLQAELEAAKKQNKIQEARSTEIEAQIEMHKKFISDMHLAWTTDQSKRDLRPIVKKNARAEPLTADTPQEANRPVSESRPTSQPQDLGIDTKSRSQERKWIPKPHVEGVSAKMAQVNLEDQPTGSTAAPHPVGPGTSSIRTRPPPQYLVRQAVALRDEGLVRVTLPVPENKSRLSRDTSRRQNGSPATSSTARAGGSLVSGGFSGRPTSRKGDDSPESLGRDRVPHVGPMYSSLRPPQLPPKNTVKPSGQAVSNKVEDDKSAKSSYSAKLHAPTSAAPRPPVLAAYTPNDPRKRARMIIAKIKKQKEEEDDGGWNDFVISSDSETEPAKTSPPASNTPRVTDQSSTTEDHGPKPAPASNAALVTDLSSTPPVHNLKRRRLN